ncbi:AVAST type 1 anti-phage system MBL fold metallo-hydrolase Avs1a [Pseudomonas sp. Irchel s3h14]|uniref:AVAST type 1 anti-phage system MBL fold metallo-hydrolase Avs1a n=1 Tax=Pseudomonas sp. Irchel s3h14 TaxID=2009179 RepID=UPI000BA452BE|nr:AVAST type 1 anti-phage system MBL fold metallo-hydrolase Avs1a [Pseudomonas sp. Irchel s3h14]
MLKIKMYPAGNGDAFLIRFEGVNILIDGGYASTFDQHIRNDLKSIALSGESLSLVIATHIDADHISGLLTLLRANGNAANPQIIRIDHVWHNSLRSLVCQASDEPEGFARMMLESIRKRGYPKPVASDARPQEISARQGSSLANLLRIGGYNWNLGDGTQLISTFNTPSVELHSAIIQVIGPSAERMDGLQRLWITELRKKGYQGPVGSGELLDDAFEFLCANAPERIKKKPVLISANQNQRLNDIYEPDTSIPNGSSIATIIELGNKRMLFLADSWVEDLLEQLHKLAAAGHSMLFDAIKISHHGSVCNTSPALLELIDAPIYLVSSNGKQHGHPDFPVLRAIVDRPAPFHRKIYLNYRTPASIRLSEYQSSSGAGFTVIEGGNDWIEMELADNE